MRQHIPFIQTQRQQNNSVGDLCNRNRYAAGQFCRSTYFGGRACPARPIGADDRSDRGMCDWCFLVWVTCCCCDRTRSLAHVCCYLLGNAGERDAHGVMLREKLRRELDGKLVVDRGRVGIVIDAWICGFTCGTTNATIIKMVTNLESAEYAFVTAAHVLGQRSEGSPECVQMPEDLWIEKLNTFNLVNKLTSFSLSKVNEHMHQNNKTHSCNCT